VLIGSDGGAVAVGDNAEGQCNIPPLDERMAYTQLSSGFDHTLLLRSDGNAAAIGKAVMDNATFRCQSLELA